MCPHPTLSREAWGEEMLGNSSRREMGLAGIGRRSGGMSGKRYKQLTLDVAVLMTTNRQTTQHYVRFFHHKRYTNLTRRLLYSHCISGKDVTSIRDLGEMSTPVLKAQEKTDK